MKFLFSLYLIFFVCPGVSAQKFHLNTFAGISNYAGDLQDKRFTFNQSKFALGVGLTYELSDKIFIRTAVTLAKVGAEDKYSKFFTRNLNFTSNIYDVQLVAEYNFRNLNDHYLSPYVFAGIGIYRFNPFTHDTAGNKFYLQPLSTEGQDFYQNRKPYNLTQFSLPFGGGVKLALTKNINTGIEVGIRKLFNDYLDDVSTTFVDENLLLNNRGPKAVELAFRSGELKTGATYPSDGSQRGDSRYKDWYYFLGFTASFRIGWLGGNSEYNKTRCPVL